MKQVTLVSLYGQKRKETAELAPALHGYDHRLAAEKSVPSLPDRTSPQDLGRHGKAGRLFRALQREPVGQIELPQEPHGFRTPSRHRPAALSNDFPVRRFSKNVHGIR